MRFLEIKMGKIIKNNLIIYIKGDLNMIVTTTGNVDGRKVVEYKGIVFGEVVSGINFLKDMGAGFRNFLGGRSQGYEQELMSTRDEAIKEMEERARAIGADAVIGMKMDYEVLGANNGMLMVTCSGTAVKLD